ncbi:DUF1152 domain-containing protein [Stygiolobus caldivivus]|uniref:DUF1152 domain-containing protein n=1 Tax=Stygiolobus caldivivus TaxID=2824673 RepID=A0A8D5U4M0_9CREN|nr:DUF1152 domain-containing protein [Stygiolobus caldivivus]BCU69008.1 hypothetical protein KN1_03050 [Stygiolobus caldivivus]
MKAFVFGLGGGGDVVSAYVAALYLESKGYETILGAVTWERYVEDPVPGPICDFENHVRVNDIITELNSRSYSIRLGKVVIPQIVRLMKSTGIPKGYSICIKKGLKDLVKGIEDFSERNNVNLVVGVDAGGDILAKGCEKTLGSPLIDFIMLNVLGNLRIKSLLATIGAGSDGELEHDYILQRISEIARLGGLKDSKGIDESIAEKLEIVLNDVRTEASRIPYEAFHGLYGRVKIRGGTREVYVTPVSSIMFFLDPKVVISTSPLAQVLKDFSSLDDANRRLNEVGIFTEYDLEKELFARYGTKSSEVEGEDVLRIREEGKKRLGDCKLVY